MRMIEEFQRGADPFLLGYGSFEHAALGFILTDGLLFPPRNGAVILRRRRMYPDVSAWTFCGSAALSATQIRNMPGFDHEADMGFQYDAAVVYGNGFASAFAEPVRVDFDGAGDRIDPPLPMFPLHLSAKPIAGGKFRVFFEYDPYGQGAWPKDFQVFAGADPGSVNYTAPLTDSATGLDYVRVVGDQRSFSFTTGAYAQGTVRVFGVRGRNSGGAAERNTRTTAAVTAMETTEAQLASIASGQQGRR